MSDEAGRFTLVQPGGMYTLTVTKAGFSTATTAPFSAADGTTVDVGTITVFYAGSAMGTVASAADGTALPGVTVSASGGLSTVTDQFGNFLLELPTGFYTFTFTKPGFGTFVSDAVSVSVGQVLEFLQVLLQPITLTSLTLNPPSLAGGQVSSGQVNLSGPAWSGGATVSLTSSNPSAAAGPATLTVPEGATSARFNVTAGHVVAATPVTITGTVAGSSKAATLTVVPWITSLTINPSSVLGGGSAAGTITLGFTAPSGGTLVTLTSTDPSTAAVPASVTVPAGAATATFQVATQPVSSAVSVTINAAVGGEVKGTALQVMPLAPTSLVLSLSPTSIAAGGSSVGTVTLNSSAPVGGAAIGLTSSDTQSATVPASVTVAAGATSATFTVATLVGAPSSTVTISATYAGVTKTATLSLVPVALTLLILNPTNVIAGESSVGTVTLNGPAPAGGAAIGLTSSDTQSATVPASVTVAAGATSAAFTVATLAGAPSSTVTISATYGSATKTATLSFVSLALTSLVLNPTTVVAGGSSVGTVTLNAPAPAGGVAIGLTSSDTQSATVPATVTVAAGATSWAFTVATFAGAPSTNVTISATYASVTKTATVALLPVPLKGVAPGWALPGDTNIVLYGSGFTGGTSIVMAGPVYSLADPSTPLCQLDLSECLTVTVQAVANATADALSFAVPDGLTPGAYYLQTQSGGGGMSPNGVWLAVDQAQKTYPPLAPGHGSTGRPIWSGQTITGTFVAGGDSSGHCADFNVYYFVATAGSTIDVALNRVDTSMSWENPASLDPTIVIGAPDGLIYQNLVSYDNQPGIDLNASLHGAVLPLSGMYSLCVQTSKGFGDYQLQFTITSMAPATTQVFPTADSFVTVPVGQTTNPAAIMLDPRGYRISGANVTFALTPSPDDTGTVDFTGGSTVQTEADGTAETTVTATSVGKVSYAPTFMDTYATSLAAAGTPTVATEGANPQIVRRIPRYQAVARQPISVAGLNADWTIRFT